VPTQNTNLKIKLSVIYHGRPHPLGGERMFAFGPCPRKWCMYYVGFILRNPFPRAMGASRESERGITSRLDLMGWNLKGD